MEYSKFENKYILRLDKEEEIISSLKDFCINNSIRLGNISGLGSTNSIKIGLFDTTKKEYFSKEFTGDFEILNLTGNISTMDREIYLHVHVTISDSELHSYGGHLNSAIVSGTAEIIIETIEGSIDRTYNPNIGLNLFDFKK